MTTMDAGTLPTLTPERDVVDAGGPAAGAWNAKGQGPRCLWDEWEKSATKR